MSLISYSEYEPSSVRWLSQQPKGWQAKPLKTVASINDETLPETTNPEEEIQYVDIGSVSLTDGIEKTEAMTFGSAPSRARRVPREGDVLVSTVRTYLKSIAAVQGQPGNLVASTGFAVVRAKPEAQPRFLKYALQEEHFIQEIISRSTGVSYPAINASDVGRVLLCVPSKGEQLAIASFLDRETAKIDALIAEQKRLIELLQEKRQAVISHAVTKGLNPNAPMKESGVEWLGEVPEHWDVKPLKRLACIDNSGCYGEEEGLSEIDLPVATTAQIDANGNFIVEKMSVRSFTLEEAARYACNPRDILVVKSSGSATNIISGKAGLVSEDTRQFVFSNFLLRARPLPEHSARYIYFLLRSSLTRSRVEKMCSTTTYPNLQVGIYCSANLPVPPLKEQREIAGYIGERLGEIDSLVNQAGALIALIEERRSALISAAVTGQIDVRGLVTEAVEQ